MAGKAKKKSAVKKKVTSKTSAVKSKKLPAKKPSKPEAKKTKNKEEDKEQKKLAKTEPRVSKKGFERAQRKNAAAEALQAALEKAPEDNDEDEFDPEAFFAASGGKGIFRSHVMRKERVDFQTDVRFRQLKEPLVFNATLLNLSKGGLCLKTPTVIDAETILRIEIPLPHTSELFSIQAKVIWSQKMETDAEPEGGAPTHTGLHFMPMSLAKQTVINNFIQQRRDELVMAKIGLDKFTDSVPVAGID